MNGDPTIDIIFTLLYDIIHLYATITLYGVLVQLKPNVVLTINAPITSLVLSCCCFIMLLLFTTTLPY